MDLKAIAPGSHMKGEIESLILSMCRKPKKNGTCQIIVGSYISIYHLVLEMRKSALNIKMLV